MLRSPVPDSFRSLRFLMRCRVALVGAVCLLAACSERPAPSGPAAPDGDPGVPAVYDLATVEGANMPALVSAGDLPGTIMRGYIDSGVITVHANGTCRYTQQGSLYINGVLTTRSNTDKPCTWQLVSEGKLRFDYGGGNGSLTFDRTWYSLTETRRIVKGTQDVDIPLVWVRR